MVGTGANGKTYRFLIEVTTIGSPSKVERRRQRQPLYLHDLTHHGPTPSYPAAATFQRREVRCQSSISRI